MTSSNGAMEKSDGLGLTATMSSSSNWARGARRRLATGRRRCLSKFGNSIEIIRWSPMGIGLRTMLTESHKKKICFVCSVYSLLIDILLWQMFRWEHNLRFGLGFLFGWGGGGVPFGLLVFWSILYYISQLQVFMFSCLWSKLYLFLKRIDNDDNA